MKLGTVEFVISRIMIALSVIIIITAAVSSPSPPFPFASSSIALAFHTPTQSDNISQAARTAQDVDKHLNDTRQALQNGNTTGALFSLGQAQQQLSLLKSGNLTTTPPVIDPLQTDLFLGTSSGSLQQQTIPSIAPPPPSIQTPPPPPPAQPPAAQQEQQQQQQIPQEPPEQLPDEPIVTPPTLPSPPDEPIVTPPTLPSPPDESLAPQESSSSLPP